ncbi:hypothetical protein GQ55_2G089300 [Panicum hallii var. hallii]|uniref:Uncharacterized protein n=1 Tax=Panicum hallii var. hallii TaxID=1504633 RepID=A0A2T7EMY7_9POAL|nr:hypothetical protein GQ55_2G089300 [Panicum hallii var. hallii]
MQCNTSPSDPKIYTGMDGWLAWPGRRRAKMRQAGCANSNDRLVDLIILLHACPDSAGSYS